MNTIHIAASREYDVLIGHGLLDELGVLVAGAVDAKKIGDRLEIDVTEHEIPEDPAEEWVKNWINLL